jgi:uncharacterized protein HemX
MTRVEQLEQQIGQLNADEFMQLRNWLLDRSEGSDRQIHFDSPAGHDSLDALRAEFDRELAVLQRPGASATMAKVFNSTPSEIADAANATRHK